MAFAAVLFFRENGIKKPEDVIITSVGDSKYGRIIPIGLGFIAILLSVILISNSLS